MDIGDWGPCRIRVAGMGLGFRVYLDPKGRKNNGLHCGYDGFLAICLHTFLILVGFRAWEMG